MVGLVRILTQLFLMAGLISSCGANPHIENGDSHSFHSHLPRGKVSGFNLSTSSYLLEASILHDIKNRASKRKRKKAKKAITFPVCFEFENLVKRKKKVKGQGRFLLTDYQKEVINAVKDSFSIWTKPLQDDDGWRVSQLKIKTLIKKKCPAYRKGNKLLTIEWRQIPGRSYALPYRIVLEFENLDINSMRKLVLHEMGHQMGLGDTYYEVGYQTPVGQPEAIMNNLWWLASPELTSDDVAGVKNVWDTIKRLKDVNQCPEGYVLGETGDNRNGNVFCVPDEMDLDNAIVVY